MRMLSLCLLCCVLAAAAAAEPVNLVTNGSFEEARAERAVRWACDIWSGPAAWTVSEQAPQSGRRCLQCGSDAAKGTAVASQVIPLLRRDQPCRVEGFWRGEALVGTGARVVCRFLGEGGRTISDAPALEKAGTFPWERFSLPLSPPAGTGSVQVFLEMWESTGRASFDSVALLQDLPPLDPTTLRLGGGATDGKLRVAVLDVGLLGGVTYGARGTQEALAAAGLQADRIADCSFSTLAHYDCVFVPELQDPGQLEQEGLRSRTGDWRAALIAYVRAGGGIVLAHDSVGFRFALERPLFPEVVRGVERSFTTGVARFADHPVTTGLQPFESAFGDVITLAAGPAGRALAYNKGGAPVLVVGESEGGRVVACGLALGLDRRTRETPPGGAEKQLLLQSVQWAAGGRRQDVAWFITPAQTRVTEPTATVQLDVAAMALTPAAAGRRCRVTVALVAGKKRVASQAVTVTAAADPASAPLTFDLPRLADGDYTVTAVRQTDGAAESPVRVVAGLALHTAGARRADALPKARFRWRACNEHGPGGLRSAAEIEQMVRDLKQMHFSALLINGKTPDGRCYYDTKLGTRAPGFADLDHIKIASEACHRAGLQCLVQFCTFAEGSPKDPSNLLKEHPEWAEYHEGEPMELSERSGDPFGCPDRREVRDYELSLIREIVTNYPAVDGISFDYIRYGDDRWCDCPHSKALQGEFARKHPELSAAAARAKFAEEQIVSFTWEVRRLLDGIRPGLILHGYCHPDWANRFPLQYLSFRASAHGDEPGRGGEWPLEQVFAAAENNVKRARAGTPGMRAAPMADTAYTAWAKTPTRFRRELRLIHAAGAQDVMVYLYTTLKATPDLRQMLAEEFAE